MTDIYALCDIELLEKYNCSFSQYIDILSNYPVKYIQYRDKINNIDKQKQNLLQLKQLTNIPIIINDKLELLKFADGLHLGQDDIKNLYNNSKELTLKLIRKKYPNKIIGLSTHNELEILEANSLDLDYIGLGAYRGTVTKRDITHILGDNISYLAKISKHKVGAIGGVKISDKIPNITYNVIGSDLLFSSIK